MKVVDICDGSYAAKWGLTDFYPESEARLKKLLESDGDFDTGWFGCAKEIRYARYYRLGDKVSIEVSAHMDDLWESDDLIYDALWAAMKCEEELPDAIIDSIREEAICAGIEDENECTAVVPAGGATFEKIVEVTKELEDFVEGNNRAMFEKLCDIVAQNVAGFGEEGV